MDERIISFIKAQTALTFATVKDDIPYCATCYYAFIPEWNCLVIKSGPETQHIQQALVNNNIAGTIVPDKLLKTKVQGLQFQGTFIVPENDMLSDAKSAYYVKYPFAIAIPGELWVLDLTSLKFTDNTLGFGKKLKWNKQ
ncbi:MAG: pyridoxamine 5'-phosphate oxidase family protein [Bacteroidia bacterium]|nr:pyridoxamine 5'-phosphate oxidase family protein [Bacteroidia bacterium]